MVDDSVKPCEYKMGRVINVFKGDDGVVRSARVKVAHGEFNRPVVKLAPVFYDSVSEIEIRAGDVGATNEQKHEPPNIIASYLQVWLLALIWCKRCNF